MVSEDDVSMMTTKLTPNYIKTSYYSDHIYSLREHIDFVRGRIRLKLSQTAQPKETTFTHM